MNYMCVECVCVHVLYVYLNVYLSIYENVCIHVCIVCMCIGLMCLYVYRDLCVHI